MWRLCPLDVATMRGVRMIDLMRCQWWRSHWQTVSIWLGQHARVRVRHILGRQMGAQPCVLIKAPALPREATENDEIRRTIIIEPYFARSHLLWQCGAHQCCVCIAMATCTDIRSSGQHARPFASLTLLCDVIYSN